jgi:serine/threonine-protein kinase
VKDAKPLPPIVPRRDPDEPYRVDDGSGKRRSYRGLIIFLVIVLLAACVGFGAWLWGSTHYQSMPDVTGLSQSQAQQTLTNDGLKYTVKQASSATVASGDVISTDPGVNQPVSNGSTVTLTVSDGPGQVSVPNVTGQSQSSATTQLKNAGFAVSVASTTQPSSSVAAGDVVSYTPSGTQTQGTTITLTISAGATQVTVPDVSGKNITDATNELKADGFNVVTHHVTLVFNTVVNQSPGGGQSSTAGATVTLYY